MSKAKGKALKKKKEYHFNLPDKLKSIKEGCGKCGNLTCKC